MKHRGETALSEPAFGWLGRAVLGAVSAASGPTSARAVAKAVRRDRNAVAATLAALARVGRIERAGRGWVALPAPRCQGTNAEGQRCGREAAIGSAFCTLHEEQAVAPVPETKEPGWFAIACSFRERVLNPVGLINYPAVADLARELPRVLRRVKARADYADAVRWSIEHDPSLRLLFDAAIDLANKYAAGKISVEGSGKGIYAEPGSLDEPEDPHDISETLL